jgi:hypothetical protein
MSGFFIVFLILLYRKIYFCIAIANSKQILADVDCIDSRKTKSKEIVGFDIDHKDKITDHDFE